MVHSDDEEEESFPQSVSNYHFEDDNKEPISFSVLPVQWSKTANVKVNKKPIFLQGAVDNGLQPLYKTVIAWRFELSEKKPEISVLTKENLWIKLQKPRKSYEPLIRTILITLQSFNFLKKNPEALGRFLWEHLSKVFSLYDAKPSQNDLVDHVDLIGEAVKNDDLLAKSQFLRAFLEERPSKRRLPDENIPTAAASGFIVDDMDDMIEDVGDDENSDDDDCYDSVCAYCDNGGDLLCCEGVCLRSFHATNEAGEDSECESLGFTKKQVAAMPKFYCENCKRKQHQCFACRKLGSSDKSSGAAEVFQCVSATCGYFYHPKCVAKLLYKGSEADAEAFRQRVVAGESFTCPVHKCYVCKHVEDKKDHQMQFALCRRCPKAYHRKCLPKEIAFEESEYEETRAWDGLLVNRILIYCLKHEIDNVMGTPVRNHITFPLTRERYTASIEKMKKTSDVPLSKEKVVLNKSLSFRQSSQRKTAEGPHKSLNSASLGGEPIKKVFKVPSGANTLKKTYSTLPSKNNRKSAMAREVSPLGNESRPSLGENSYNSVKDSDYIKLGRRCPADSESNRKARMRTDHKKLSSGLLTLDANSERRLMALIEESASSITMDDVVRKHEVPSTHAHSLKHVIDKSITQGKIEGSVEAVRAALAKLIEGGSIEDAKTVCQPEVLNQLTKWKDKLRVYLAPFLHGMRYTSFGRHFTKMEKLQEIVDRLHWYAQDGDMVVDFCCGANDFSCLMKKKLEEMGKKCLFKNYDVIQPKNNFEFEKRDWMTVRKEELPPGSKLIMGINPPFGFKAALANKFIDKALEFEPKLLILIVPQETERLDRKKGYELVWEDDQFLSGKSFYLPGSVDEKDKQMDQWNQKAPPLSLWSHPNYVRKHKDISQSHNHKAGYVGGSGKEQENFEGLTLGTTGYEDSASLLVDYDVPMEIDEPDTPRGPRVSTVVAEEGDEHSKGQGRQGYENHQPKDALKRRKHEKENSGGLIEDSLLLDEQDTEKSKNKKNWEVSHISEANVVDKKSGYENHQPKDVLKRRKHEKESSGVLIEDSLLLDEQDTEKSKNRKNWEVSRKSEANVIDKKSPFRDIPSSQQLNPSRLDSHGSPRPMFYGVNHSADLSGRHNMADESSPSRTHRPRDGANLPRQVTPHSRDTALDGSTFYRQSTPQTGENPLDYRMYDATETMRVTDKRPQYPFYGQDAGYGNIRSLTSPAYAHLGPAPGSSYRMQPSAIQRYAPRLDELNHTRMNPVASEPPPLGMINSQLTDSRLQTPYMSSTGLLDPRALSTSVTDNASLASRTTPPGLSAGFATGPYNRYLSEYSSGWLND